PEAPSRLLKRRNSSRLSLQSDRPIGADQNLAVAPSPIGMGERVLYPLNGIDRVPRRAEAAVHHLPAKLGIDLADLGRVTPRKEAAQHEAGELDAAIDEVGASHDGVLAAHRAVVHQR